MQVYDFTFIFYNTFIHTYTNVHTYINKLRMEDEGLLDLEDDIVIKETQDTPNTFSKNLIKKLGICRNRGSGTEAVSLNNPHVQLLYSCMAIDFCIVL